MEHDRRRSVPHAFAVLSALAVVTGWAVLGHGLFGTPVDTHYADELDGGGWFGVNLALYWPFYLLTVPVVAGALSGLVRRPATLLPVASSLTLSALFTTWVISVDENAYRPELADAGLWVLAIDLGALVLLCTAALAQPEPPAAGPGARAEDASVHPNRHNS